MILTSAGIPLFFRKPTLTTGTIRYLGFLTNGEYCYNCHLAQVDRPKVFEICHGENLRYIGGHLCANSECLRHCPDRLSNKQISFSLLINNYPQYFTATILEWQHLLKTFINSAVMPLAAFPMPFTIFLFHSSHHNIHF